MKRTPYKVLQGLVLSTNNITYIDKCFKEIEYVHVTFKVVQTNLYLLGLGLGLR